jgi:hypothetical protein
VDSENQDFLGPEMAANETHSNKITNLHYIIWRLDLMILMGANSLQGHCKRWVLKIKTFWALTWQQAKLMP